MLAGEEGDHQQEYTGKTLLSSKPSFPFLLHNELTSGLTQQDQTKGQLLIRGSPNGGWKKGTNMDPRGKQGMRKGVDIDFSYVLHPKHLEDKDHEVDYSHN